MYSFVTLNDIIEMTEVPSPCIQICNLDSKDVCFGCRRTLTEIGNWSKYTNEEKEEIIKKTRERINVTGETPSIGFLR